MRRLLGMTTGIGEPASWFRFVQLIPFFEGAGWDVDHRPRRPSIEWSSSLTGRLPRALHHLAGRMAMRWNRRQDVRSAGDYDVVFVNRDLVGRGSGSVYERKLIRRNPHVIYDFDDAVFAGNHTAAVRYICEHAAWITPGNEYLAEYARQYNDNVTVIPTIIDTDMYVPRAAEDYARDGLVRIGWSGSDMSIGSTLFPHLEMLADIQKRTPFELVIVSNSKPKLPVSDLRWSFHPWKREDEHLLAEKFDIGLMPLVDNEFQRGKCGLKLLQYMAAGLPTVASPVGVNAEITLHGRTGTLASHVDDWRESLEALVESAGLRADLGQAGRQRCVDDYSINRWLPTLIDIFHSVAGTERSAEAGERGSQAMLATTR